MEEASFSHLDHNLCMLNIYLWYYVLSQAGCPNFVSLALKFVYGDDCVPLEEGRIAGVQTLSGTGGLRIFGEMMHQNGHEHIYVPNPTWGNQ